MRTRHYAFAYIFAFLSPSMVWGQIAEPVALAGGSSIAPPAAIHSDTVSAPATAKSGPQPTIRSVVEVTSNTEEDVADGSAPIFHATPDDIQASAGTYGDFSRYLQLFPGVVFNSDESDDVLVRGGNPIENLYLLDGIEVPNINHIATATTTGGLVSMIDTSALGGIDFQTGGYDASYEERLSSVINIHTREIHNDQPFTETDFGFIGAGGIQDAPLRNNGSILVSAHRSLLNLFTNNIGLNGVPIYTNALVHAQLNPGESDSIVIDSLGGIDSININPIGLDEAETNTIDTQYQGWRTTTGIRWRHIYSPRAFGTFTLSESEQNQNIQQQDQLFDDTVLPGQNAQTVPLVPVYSELTHDGLSNVKYDGYKTMGSHFTGIFGASAHLYRIAYNVAQPYGEQSPLNSDPQRSDATSFSPHFWTGETGSYAQLFYALGHWSLSGGGRLQTFAFGGHVTATPRLKTAYAFTEHTAAHASFGSYAQLPPFLYLTSFLQNYQLNPIKVREVVAGIDLYKWNQGDLGVEAYQKNYRDYPVSTEYPSLSLANMVDTLGQEFIWIPMTSRGSGIARGVELTGTIHILSNASVQANVAYARSLYSGLDGKLRPGNFDFPVVFNASGTYRAGRHYEFAIRYEYSSGRPYTPFQYEESVAQNRAIYDLSMINAERGPFYSRLDFNVNRTFSMRSHRLVAYGGLENALDRQNFLGYAWMPRYGLKGVCLLHPVGYCISAQSQMGLFPNFGARYVF